MSSSSSSSSSSDDSCVQKLKSGKWHGWFKDEREIDEEHESGEKWDVEIKIRFHKDGHFTARGSDEVGDFHFENGKVDDDQKVNFLKVYSTHSVSYEGEVDDGKIKGRWWLTDAPSVEGKFKMWCGSD